MCKRVYILIVAMQTKLYIILAHLPFLINFNKFKYHSLDANEIYNLKEINLDITKKPNNLNKVL
jgi:hypothetical protein